MKRVVSSVLIACMIACMLAVSVPVYADPPALPPTPALSPGEVPIGATISPMKKGQVAPYTGLLLSPAAIASIIVQMQNAQNETDIQVKKAVDTQKAQDQLTIDNQNATYQFLKTTTDEMVKNRDAEIKELTQKVDSEEKNKPNLPLWVGGGVVGGIVLSVLTVFAVSAASK